MSAVKPKPSMAAGEAVAAGIDSAADTSAKTYDASVQSYEKSLGALREGMEKATKGFETSQAKMKEGLEKMVKTSEELLAFSQGNLEAFFKASQIYASGVQDISKHVAASSKTSLEETMSFGKSLMGVKSVKEAVDLQTGFAKAAIEKAVTESNKLTDAAVKLTEQALAPLTARITKAVETFSKTH